MSPERETYLARMWAHDLEWSEQHIIEAGMVDMMAIICAPDKTLIIEPRGLGISEREEVLGLFRCACVAHAAFSITVMSEAWARIGLQIIDGVRPSEAPDRIEVLSLVNNYLDDETGEIGHRVSLRPIERGADDQIVGLAAAYESPAGTSLIGGLAEFLPIRTPTFAEVRQAREVLWRVRSRYKIIHPPGHA
jgi:hypothetical protein